MSRGDGRSSWIDDTLGNRPFIVAALYLASFFLPILILVGVPLAYIFRREPSEDWEASHYRYLARTFWLALGLGVLVVVLSLIAFLALGANEHVGLPVVFVAGLVVMATLGQFGIRSVLSLSRAVARQPMPKPDTLLF